MPTSNQVREHKVFSDLLRAKWDAVGYDGDDETIEEFDREYGNVAIGDDEDEAARRMANNMNKIQNRTSATGK
jgi:hypothetical protein